MSKTIFINASNPNCINYDLDEKTSWKNTPRLLSLKKGGRQIPVCLSGLQSDKLPVELLPSLERMSDWASLCTSSFKMREGFYPLLLDGHTLFFTDKEECSMMDQYWALNNIYKIQLEKEEVPQFESFTIEKPEDKGWQRGVIKAQNICVGELFGIVKEACDQIKKFCDDNKGAKLEISYKDKYVKNELSLIICIQFIKDVIDAVDSKDYSISLFGEYFHNNSANDERYRNISNQFISDAKRDEVGYALAKDNRFTFTSQDGKNMPHYRELLIRANKDGRDSTLCVMPDAGLAHWKLDGKNCRKKYNVGDPIDPQMPIISDAEQVYYVKAQ